MTSYTPHIHTHTLSNPHSPSPNSNKKTQYNGMYVLVQQLVTEEQLLEKIKSAAVISKNTSVHRKEFYSIKQSPGEPINLFVAKLKAKAENCNFTIKCTSDACDHKSNSYSESMIADQMTAGILDKDIQEELLSRDKELLHFKHGMIS